MNKGLARPVKWLWVWRLGMALVLLTFLLMCFLAYHGGWEILGAWWKLPAAAGGAVAAVGWYGRMAWWMARSPGGLRGWRFGLLLIPVLGLAWNLVEFERIAVGVSRGRRLALRLGVRVAAAVSALLLLGCAALAGWEFFYAVIEEQPVPWPAAALVAAVLLWGLSFEVAAGMLNNCARFREVEPNSSARFRRQLVWVVGLGVGLPLALAAGWWGYYAWRIHAAIGRIAAAGLTDAIPEELRPDIDPEAEAELNRCLAGIPRTYLNYLHCDRWTASVDRRWRRQLAEYAEAVAGFDRWLNSETRFEADQPAVEFLMNYYWMALRLADADGDREAVRANLERLEKLFARVPAWRFIIQMDFLTGIMDWSASGGLARLEEADLARLRQSPLLRDHRLEHRVMLLDPELVALRDGQKWTKPWLVRDDAQFWEWIAWWFENSTRDYWDWSMTREISRRLYEERVFASLMEDDWVSVAGNLSDLVRILVALEEFRRARGGFPERLEELTPEFLESVPVNRHDRRPAEYQAGMLTRYVAVARPRRGDPDHRETGMGRGRMSGYGFGPDDHKKKPGSKDLTGEWFHVSCETIRETGMAVRVKLGALSCAMPLEPRAMEQHRQFEEAPVRIRKRGR